MAENNVAKVTLEVGADTSKVAGQVAAAKAQVEAGGVGTAADKVTAAQQKQIEQLGVVGSKLKDIKKTYGEQIEVVQGLIGKVAAVGAVATTFYKIGEAISTYVIERLKTATENLETFRSTLDKTNTAAAQIKIADKFDELNQRLSNVNAQFRPITNALLEYLPSVGRILADDAKLLGEEIKGLNDIAQATANNARRIRKSAQDEAATKSEAAAQAAAAKSLDELIYRAKLDSLKEEERLEAEAQARILEIIKAHNAMAAADRLAKAGETAAAIAAIEDKAAADIEARRKKAEEDAARKREEEQRKAEEEREAYRRWYEEQQQAARQVQQAWTNAFRAIRDENNKAFATDQAASMVQFAQQLRIEGMVAQAGMNRIVEGN